MSLLISQHTIWLPTLPSRPSSLKRWWALLQSWENTYVQREKYSLVLLVPFPTSPQCVQQGRDAVGGHLWLTSQFLTQVLEKKRLLKTKYPPCKTIEWFWLEGTFRSHLVPSFLKWAGTSPTRSGCSEPRPTCWMFPRMGHLPPLRVICSSVSPPSW